MGSGKWSAMLSISSRLHRYSGTSLHHRYDSGKSRTSEEHGSYRVLQRVWASRTYTITSVQ